MNARPAAPAARARCAGLLAAVSIVLLAAGAAARAEPIVPRDDAEVIEQLPAAGSARGETQRLRRELALHPDDAVLAASLARRYLDLARTQGDPRFAGLALAALRRWGDADTAPPPVLLLQATLDQHLHDFDAAAARLGRLLHRQPRDAQAWLTLATVRRVQGRYAESDAACRGLAGSGAALHAEACAAENEGLRGRFDSARRSLQRLAETPRLDGATRAWLLTTRAELEQRSGDAAAADAAWRAASQAGSDGYAALGQADFLIAQGRDDAALAALAGQPSSDAVVLRRAIVAARRGGPAAPDTLRDLRERLALAAQRPDVAATHGRELAMAALWIDGDAARAVALARGNLERQREPVDLLLLAQAAQRSGAGPARDELRRLAAAQGLVDRRLAVLL